MVWLVPAYWCCTWEQSDNCNILKSNDRIHIEIQFLATFLPKQSKYCNIPKGMKGFTQGRTIFMLHLCPNNSNTAKSQKQWKDSLRRSIFMFNLCLNNKNTLTSQKPWNNSHWGEPFSCCFVPKQLKNCQIPEAMKGFTQEVHFHF